MKTNFRKINVQDRILSMVQDNVGGVLNKLSLQKILNGNYIEKIVIKTGDNQINHGLPILTGWIVTRIDAPVTIYEKPMVNPKILILNCSANANINLMVF